MSVKYNCPVGSKKCVAAAKAEIVMVATSIQQTLAVEMTGFELFTKEKRRFVRDQLKLAMEEGGGEGTKVKKGLMRTEMMALWEALDPDEREAWNDLAQNWCEMYDGAE